MHISLNPKIVASFLLLVFSATTIAGFACSIGINLGYNAAHHSNEKKASNVISHQPSCHKVAPAIASSNSSELNNPNSDCCTNGVNTFALLDKSLSTLTVSVQTHPIETHSYIDNLPFSIARGYIVTTDHTNFRRSCFFNHTDIRVAIQSFQI